MCIFMPAVSLSVFFDKTIELVLVSGPLGGSRFEIANLGINTNLFMSVAIFYVWHKVSVPHTTVSFTFSWPVDDLINA